MKLQELKDYLSGLPNDFDVTVLGLDVVGLSMKEEKIDLLLEDIHFEIS